MSAPLILAYSDAYAHCMRFMEGHGPASPAVVRNAVAEAYQTIMGAHDWPFLTGNHRIQLQAPQSTGTVVYDHTGGSSERLLTLTGDTFPTDAADWSIRLDGVVCDVAQYIDTTHVTLDVVMNPGVDVASTTFKLYQRWYALPNDFIAMMQPISENWLFGREVTMTQMLQLDRQTQSSGSITHYAVAERPDAHGYKAIFVWPTPGSAASMDFIYIRRPRALRHCGHATGDIAGLVTVSSGSTALTGASSTFIASMQGALIRFGTTSVRGDWEFGDNPYVEQQTIRAVGSATALTLAADAGAAHTSVRYRITDPIDVHQEAHNAFKRYCEYHLSIARHLPDLEKTRKRAEDALLSAMGATNTTRSDPLDAVSYGAVFPGTTEWD